jgi:chromosome segregation ATPase
MATVKSIKKSISVLDKRIEACDSHIAKFEAKKADIVEKREALINELKERAAKKQAEMEELLNLDVESTDEEGEDQDDEELPDQEDEDADGDEGDSDDFFDFEDEEGEEA